MKNILIISLLVISAPCYSQYKVINTPTYCEKIWSSSIGGFSTIKIITDGCDSGKIILKGDTIKSIEELVDAYMELNNRHHALKELTYKFNLENMFVIWDDQKKRADYKKAYKKYNDLDIEYRKKNFLCPYNPNCGVDHSH